MNRKELANLIRDLVLNPDEASTSIAITPAGDYAESYATKIEDIDIAIKVEVDSIVDVILCDIYNPRVDGNPTRENLLNITKTYMENEYDSALTILIDVNNSTHPKLCPISPELIVDTLMKTGKEYLSDIYGQYLLEKDEENKEKVDRYQMYLKLKREFDPE